MLLAVSLGVIPVELQDALLGVAVDQRGVDFGAPNAAPWGGPQLVGEELFLDGVVPHFLLEQPPAYKVREVLELDFLPHAGGLHNLFEQVHGCDGQKQCLLFVVLDPIEDQPDEICQVQLLLGVHLLDGCQLPPVQQPQQILAVELFNQQSALLVSVGGDFADQRGRRQRGGRRPGFRAHRIFHII